MPPTYLSSPFKGDKERFVRLLAQFLGGRSVEMALRHVREFPDSDSELTLWENLHDCLPDGTWSNEERTEEVLSEWFAGWLSS